MRLWLYRRLRDPSTLQGDSLRESSSFAQDDSAFRGAIYVHCGGSSLASASLP